MNGKKPLFSLLLLLPCIWSVSAFALSPNPAPTQTPKPMATPITGGTGRPVCAYCVDWKYEKPYEGANYVRIVRVDANRYQFFPGWEYENKVIFDSVLRRL